MAMTLWRSSLKARPFLWAGVWISLSLWLCLSPLTAGAAETSSTSKGNVRLFGTVEFRSPVKNLPDWVAVLTRNEKNPIFMTGSKLNAQVTWEKLQAMTKGKTVMEQLKTVNAFWNQWPYRLDIDVYKKQDYWAAPYEFRKNSGDCEDYCIVKYFTLKALGFDPAAMRIVVVKDTIRNLAHAVLAVYLDDDVYILDNVSRAILPHTRLKQYVPQYSVNEQYRWAHVRPKK